MAKSRMIRPETWTDEKFVSTDPLARLLFIGMWNYACDNGHLDDSPMQLKMRVLPADNCDVVALLDALVESGMVARENGYLKVVNLSKKQPLDQRFLVFCDHCENDPDRHYHPEDKKGTRRPPVERTSSTPSAPVEDTTSARRSGDGDGDGDGQVGAASRFGEFYDLYPKKVNRKAAETKWKAATKRADADTIIEALRAQLPQMQRLDKQFIPAPDVWLNKGKWEDEIETEDAKPQRKLSYEERLMLEEIERNKRRTA